MAGIRVDESPEDLYFEDHLPGSVYVLGSVSVTEEEIVAFAKRYDPQVFHTDPEAAKDPPSVDCRERLAHRRPCDAVGCGRSALPSENLGSPGVDEVRWLKPVRPGDTLTIRVTIIEARRSQSKPDRGVVKALVEALDQAGEVVTTWKGINIVLCRNGGLQGP